MWVHGHKEYNEPSTLDTTVLIHVRTPAVLPTVAFVPSEQILPK